MDITPMFKACVMTVKLRKKAPSTNKNRILQKQSKNEFCLKLKDLRHQISSLKELLMENRSAYMKFAYFLKNSVQMSDEQRDLIDRESEKIILFCTQYLGQLRSECHNSNVKKHLVEHFNNVLELLSSYLKNVQQIHIEQKQYRMQHELDTYKLVKLESNKRKIPVMSGNHLLSDSQATFNSNLEDSDENGVLLTKHHSDKKISAQKSVAIDDDDTQLQQQRYNEELSPEDIQVLESENVQLYHELQGLAEEVEQIEKNVVDIAKLQEIFTEKVVLQKFDIERIANTVVGATENVKDANEHIKQAIQRNAGLRVWTLFFLIVMSFTLLFLDWYND